MTATTRLFLGDVICSTCTKHNMPTRVNRARAALKEARAHLDALEMGMGGDLGDTIWSVQEALDALNITQPL